MKIGPSTRTLAVAVAVLLAVALFAAGVGVGRSTKPPPTSPATAPAPAAVDDTTTTTAAAAAPAPVAPAAPAVEANARSVAYEGAVPGLTSVRLAGRTDLNVSGHVYDASGASKGPGVLSLRGNTLAVSASTMTMTASAALRLSRGTAKLVTTDTTFGSSVARVDSTGRVTLAAPEITFTPQGEGATPTKLASPVSVDGVGTIDVRGVGDLQWTDAPATLALTHRGTRSTLSWAGSGVVRAGGTDHRAGFLGVKADNLDVTVERTGSTYRLRGDVDVAQVYADGLPKLPAQARVRLKALPGKVARGQRAWFTWAPENDGRTDMVMTRIRPANAEAQWVSLGLDTLPPMCGGETCPTRGGVTAGFTSGKPINAVILPRTGDERSISFRVPDAAALGRHQLVIVVEGNFDPVQVVVDFEVVAPTTTTTA